jgi:hypothetical protein
MGPRPKRVIQTEEDDRQHPLNSSGGRQLPARGGWPLPRKYNSVAGLTLAII